MGAFSRVLFLAFIGLLLGAGIAVGQEATEGDPQADDGAPEVAGEAAPDDAGAPVKEGEGEQADSGEEGQSGGPVTLEEIEAKEGEAEVVEAVEAEVIEAVEVPIDAVERAFFVEALEVLERGKWGEARDMLDRYLLTYPKGRYAAAAVEIDQMAARLGAAQASEVDRSGRTELVIFSTMYGVWLGTGLGVLGDLEGGTLLLSALGAAGGLGLSLGLTSDERRITRGQATLVTSSGVWGTWTGLGLGLGAEAEDEVLVGAALSTGALSVLTGSILASSLDPHEGDVALFNSGGLWGMVLALSSVLIVQPSGFRDEDFLTAMAIGADLGLIGAGFLAKEVDMSRGRVWLIDVSGLAGLLGAGIIASAVADDAPPAVAGSLLLLGAGGGLLLGTMATEDWDKEDAYGITFDLDPPSPFVAPRQREGGQREMIYGVHLLQGRF